MRAEPERQNYRLGDWLDLGRERRAQEMIQGDCEVDDGSTNRKRRVRRETRFGGGKGWGGGRWFILFRAHEILGAGELPVLHLCSVLSTTIDATIPSPLCPSSL